MLHIKYKKSFFLFIIIFTILLLITLWVLYSKEKNLNIYFLNVGQGDAILIKSPYGQNILIDTGDGNFIIQELDKYLSWWEKNIDLVIITHPHDDHIGGINKLFHYYKIKKILYTGVVHSSPNFLAFLENIQNNETPILIASKQNNIKLSPDQKKQLILKILYPKENFFQKEINNLNNSSIISKLIYHNTSFLFMGDAEKEVEEELINDHQNNIINLRSDVIKLGHHGSNTSNTDTFLQSVKPEFGIIQVGKNNNFNHPSPRILKRLQRNNIQIYRNDLHGGIHVDSDGNKIKIQHENLK